MTACLTFFQLATVKTYEPTKRKSTATTTAKTTAKTVATKRPFHFVIPCHLVTGSRMNGSTLQSKNGARGFQDDEWSVALQLRKMSIKL